MCVIMLRACRTAPHAAIRTHNTYRPTYFRKTSSVFLPPLSLYLPTIILRSIFCWGTFLNFLAFFAPQAQYSTAQPMQPAQQSAKQVRADQSAITQATRQSLLEPACRRVFIHLAVFSKRTEKFGPKNLQPFTKQLSWCDVACTLLSSLPFLLRPCMQRPGYFRGPWSSCCKSSVCTYNHEPLCPLHSLVFLFDSSL